MANQARQQRTLIEKARHRRANPSRGEQLLWERLRNRKMRGLKFNAQHVLLGLIVDFYCSELRVAVEIRPDGLKYGFRDEVRILREHGATVLRFTETEVVQHTEWVLRIIYGVCRAEQRRRAGLQTPERDDVPAVTAEQGLVERARTPIERVGRWRAGRRSLQHSASAESTATPEPNACVAAPAVECGPQTRAAPTILARLKSEMWAEWLVRLIRPGKSDGLTVWDRFEITSRRRRNDRVPDGANVTGPAADEVCATVSSTAATGMPEPAD